MSFILEEDNLLEIQNDCEREKLDNIQCNFIYINPNSYIDKMLFIIIFYLFNVLLYGPWGTRALQRRDNLDGTWQSGKITTTP